MIVKIKQGNEVRTVIAENGILVSEVINIAGFSIPMPCAGEGRCKKCLVNVSGKVSEPEKNEAEFLSKSGLSSNLRLACKTHLLGEAIIELPEKNEAKIITEIKYSKNANNELRQVGETGVAIDIGTTTIAAYLFDIQNKTLIRSEASVNPQISFGADVISRIEKSLQGRGDELAKIIRDELNRLIAIISKGYSPKNAVITGNTTMLYLLTGRNVITLSSAPFEADCLFGYEIPAQSIGINGVENVYLPECISAFAGADLSCAVLSSGIFESGKNSLLVDIGTNGEIYLNTKNGSLCCSAAAGPAFEGSGITMGMNASNGAVYEVWDENDEVYCKVIGNGKSIGICGTGVLDAVATFLKLGFIDESGMMHSGNKYYRFWRGEKCLKITDDVVLTQGDIRAVQLAKAAIRGAIETILIRADITPDELDEVIIAGGFGSFMNINSAVAIGMLPVKFKEKAYAVGNASAAGAVTLLTESSSRNKLEFISKNVKYIELSSDIVFSDNYIEAINFCSF